MPYSVNQEIYIDFLPQDIYVSSGVWRFELVPQDIKVGTYTFYLPSSSVRNAQTRFYAPTPEATPDTKAPTMAPTKAPDEDVTPEAPTPTEEPVLSQAEAEQIVRTIIQLTSYSIELLDDHLMIDGAEYFSFCINDAGGVGLEPLLIVEKKSGELLCYDLSGVVAPIEKFPLDKTETGNEGEKTLSAEEAKQVLLGYSGEQLGLAKETASYEMTVDDWTTMANGVTCYGVNFFETVGEKQRFRGTFYVALDGSAVFSKDDVTGDFIKR